MFDGMVLLQQLEKEPLRTFGDVSRFILKRILVANTVYFVTDQYKPNSIKSLERKKRGSAESIRYTILRRDTVKPSQWSKYLRDGENKTELVAFLLKDWSENEECLKILSNHVLFVNSNDSFYKLTCQDNVVCL